MTYNSWMTFLKEPVEKSSINVNGKDTAHSVFEIVGVRGISAVFYLNKVGFDLD